MIGPVRRPQPRPGQRRRLRRWTAAAAGLLLAIVTSGAALAADPVRDAQWHVGFLRLAQAHSYSEGAGIIVAVIDTGVDAGHPDLVDSLLPGYDSTPGGGASAGHTDVDGHGTAMAGLIAAHGRALGVAPQARILPIRTSLLSPAGGDPTAGIDWAVDHGARVLCLAFGQEDTPTLRTAVRRALDHDVVVVASIGNQPQIPGFTYPAGYPGVIGAAGVDQHGNHAAVSVVGAQAVLAAPAVDIVSTGLRGPGRTGYVKGDGTSNATAIIAGVAALVRAKYPALPATEVVRLLTATADDKGPPGRDDQYGYGVVNPVRALTAELPTSAVNVTASGSPLSGDPASRARAATPGSGATGSHATGVSDQASLCIGLILAISVLLVFRQARRRRAEADDSH